MKDIIITPYTMFKLVLLITLLALGQCQSNTTHIPEIYGVRWFLGEHFQFTTDNLDDNNEYFVLMFNSDEQILGDLAVSIAKNKFSCSSKFISTEANQNHHTDIIKNGSEMGDVDQTFLHKCVVSNIQGLSSVGNSKTVKYQILLGNIKITQNVGIQSGGYKELVLFTEVFRLPNVQEITDILWIGDWGQITTVGTSKGFLDIKPCLSKEVDNNQKLSMAFFLGDMAYDLQGPLYYSMLKYIQFITSKMVFMVTPGNHDTLYHSDTFKLFVQSFYSSQWKQYSNYFYTLKVGKLAFIAYNPQKESYDFKSPDRLQLNFTEVFQNQLTTQIINSLNNHYFTIVFSHYPIYCSKTNDSILTCDKNPQRLATYRQYFSKINMKLYFSGHLHVYERTKPICSDGTFFNQTDNNDTYNYSCPIYVVEGAGGNDIFIETKALYPLKNFSKKLVYNSGYGILTISSDSAGGYPKNVSYRHVSAQKCGTSDNFVMLAPKTTPAPSQPDDNLNLLKVMLKISLASLSFSAIIMFALYITKKCKKTKDQTNQVSSKTQKDGHIEMVEQHIQAPVNKNSETNE